MSADNAPACVDASWHDPRKTRTMKLFLRHHALIATAALALCSGFAVVAHTAARAQPQGEPQPRLPTTDITAGMHVIKAELAVTPQQQSMGMMFRREMPGNEGMLFVAEDSQVRCFWMKNTLIPLSIAFIADDGSIVNIAEMQALNERSHCSTKPVRYALEMPQGWFAKKGIAAGFKLRGKPFGN
jgi:uncharacterized protein